MSIYYRNDKNSVTDFCCQAMDGPGEDRDEEIVAPKGAQSRSRRRAKTYFVDPLIMHKDAIERLASNEYLSPQEPDTSTTVSSILFAGNMILFSAMSVRDDIRKKSFISAIMRPEVTHHHFFPQFGATAGMLASIFEAHVHSSRVVKGEQELEHLLSGGRMS